MSAQIMNMAVMFGIMQAANHLEIDKEENVNYIRIAYVVSQVIQFCIIGWIYYKINQKKGISHNYSHIDSTPLVFTEAKNPMDPADVSVVETTVQEYDIKQLFAHIQQSAIGIAILAFIHLKWGYIRPLTLQCILGLKTLAGIPIVQLHLFGKPAKDELARPFKPKSIFGDMQQTQQPTVKEVKVKEKKELKKKLNRYD